MDQPHTRNTPRDVFIYILMMASLYASAGACIALLFQYINVAFPDMTHPYYPGILDTIRRSEAILIVAFPLYLLLAWIIERAIVRTPDMREFKLRKWLIYLTLFISAVTIAVDLITLIYNFLGGDLATPFLLKVAAVFAASLPIFGYYLWEVRRGSDAASRIPQASAFLSALAMIAVLAAGFVIVGSPGTQRRQRLDIQRIQDLQNIQGQVVNYWTNKQKLPDALVALTDDISGFAAPLDPDTAHAYSYRATSALSFELCAVFSAVGGQWEDSYIPTAPRAISPGASYPEKTAALRGYDTWRHTQGRACFTRTIDPDIYRPAKPISQ